MLILHIFENLGYTVYIGSHGKEYIYNIVPSEQQKPSGGYTSLKWIAHIKQIPTPYIYRLMFKAKEIIGEDPK